MNIEAETPPQLPFCLQRYLRDVVDDVLVLVGAADKAGLLQGAQVAADLPLLLLQGQLTVLQGCLATLQALRSIGVLLRTPFHQLSVIYLLHTRARTHTHTHTHRERDEGMCIH